MTKHLHEKKRKRKRENNKLAKICGKNYIKREV